MWRDRASDAMKRTPTRSCNGVATGGGSGEVDRVLYCIQQDEGKLDQPLIVLRFACACVRVWL